ncbi:MAG: hypothetical protein Q9187_001868 [Circinaria calcarea]
MHFTQVAFTFLLYSSFTAAWPWPPSIQNVEDLIAKRQEGTATSASGRQQTSPSQASPSASNSAASASATITRSANSPGSASGSAPATSGGSKGTGTTKGATTGKGSAKPTATTPTSIDQRLPAGGIQMLTPSALAAPSYYKIGDQITFGWNYTSLIVTPTAIDIIVSCTANSATYTISSNATVQPTGQAVWDTARDAQGDNPLLTDTYTLVIHDAARDITAAPAAGYLGSYSQFRFGMYRRQEYTPLNGKLPPPFSSLNVIQLMPRKSTYA